MLEKKYQIGDTENVSKQYISAVFSQSEQPLYNYMRVNGNLFMKSILSSPVDGFTDKSDVAVFIINDPTIAEEYKMAYIERLETLIDILADIDDVKYQTELIAKKGVQYTADNILEYFGNTELTDHLSEFINSGSVCLDYKDVGNTGLV